MHFKLGVEQQWATSVYYGLWFSPLKQALLGNVHVSVGLAIAVGSMPGSILGASLVKRIPKSRRRALSGIIQNS